jgi:hypothetical protein
MEEEVPVAKLHYWGTYRYFSALGDSVVLADVQQYMVTKHHIPWAKTFSVVKSLGIETKIMPYKVVETGHVNRCAFIPISALRILMDQLHVECPDICKSFNISQPPIDCKNPVEGVRRALCHLPHVAPFHIDGVSLPLYFRDANIVVLDDKTAFMTPGYIDIAARIGAKCIVVDRGNVFDVIAQLFGKC